MNDQYDIFCIMTLNTDIAVGSDPYNTDNVQCACAELLHSIGLGTLSNHLTAKRTMMSAAQIIPTTTNVN